jgi:hypothetical protein
MYHLSEGGGLKKFQNIDKALFTAYIIVLALQFGFRAYVEVIFEKSKTESEFDIYYNYILIIEATIGTLLTLVFFLLIYQLRYYYVGAYEHMKINMWVFYFVEISIIMIIIIFCGFKFQSDYFNNYYSICMLVGLYPL